MKLSKIEKRRAAILSAYIDQNNANKIRAIDEFMSWHKNPRKDIFTLIKILLSFHLYDIFPELPERTKDRIFKRFLIEIEKNSAPDSNTVPNKVRTLDLTKSHFGVKNLMKPKKQSKNGPKCLRG